MPGTVNAAAAAGGSAGMLALYTTGRAPGFGRAGYHRSTPSSRSRRGAEPLEGS